MFSQPIKRFTFNLEALRDFVDLIHPFLSEKYIEYFKKNAINLAPLFLALHKLEPEEYSLDEDARDKLINIIGSDVNVEHHEDGATTVKYPTEGALRGDFDPKKSVRAIEKFLSSDSQMELLYNSALISLVSSAEWFLSQLFHKYYENHPNAIGESNKLLSLKDLYRLGSIEDARAYIVNSEIESILRGSFDDWAESLGTRLDLKMGYLDSHKEALVEVCQRRNLLVHSNGIVNATYLSKVSDSFRNGLSVGDSIEVSPEYLNSAISRFELIFILIAAELWKKHEPKNDVRGELLIEVSYDNLLAERYDISEGLSLFLMQDKQLPERSQLVGKVNYWLSVKYQERFEEVQSDVSDYDFSAKHAIFSLAQATLLDDEDRFFSLLPHLLETEKFPLKDLHEWPLFKKMRNTDRFQKEYPVQKEFPDE